MTHKAEMVDTSGVKIGQSDLSASISEVDRVALFVTHLLGIAGNPNASDVHSFGLEESMEFYENLKGVLAHQYPNLWNEMGDNVAKQGSFCLDIGCGYMNVGRRIAKDLGIKYVGMDIVNKPWIRLLDGQEYFVPGDIFQVLPQLSTDSVPLILLNNFDPSTFYKMSTSPLAMLRERNNLQIQLFQQCDRVLNAGGYLIALGTTAAFPNWKPFSEYFSKYEDITEEFTTATILRKPSD